MNKKIFLLRSNSTKFGGAENYLYRLSRELKRQEIEHEIIHSLIPKFLPSWVRALFFNLQVNLSKKERFYYSFDRITCPDVYRAGDGVHKVFLSLEKKSKLNLLHPVYLYLEKRCFKNSKLIISNSEMVKQQIIDNYDIDSKKIKVVYNGIEFKKSNYQKSFAKLSTEFSISKHQSIILFVGSGFKRKGVCEFLKIFSQLKSKNVRGFIIGQDKNIEYYENISKKLKINDKVTFTGPRIDVDDFYSISDILLFPTHYDPFSNVVLEAMYYHNAVFTTSLNGASELLDKNFIMHNANHHRVIESIDYLLQNRPILDEVKASNKKISEQFSIAKNLDKTLRVINKLG